MGRPPKKNEDKRQQVNVRFDPGVKALLQEAAGEQSLGAEVERRVVESLRRESLMDSETARLFEALAAEIASIQDYTKKRWHKDHKTWAAVRHMLAEGPIQQLNPDKPFDDSFVSAAWDKVNMVRQKKLPLVLELEAFGINAPIEAPRRRHGLLSYVPGGRVVELAIVEDLLLNEIDRAQARQFIQQLSALDEEQAEYASVLADALKPYWEAASVGVTLYRNLKFSKAMEDIRAGRDPALGDFV